VDTAEEQPAQIAAVQKKEPAQKKKFTWKKPGRWPPTSGNVQAVSGSGSGSGSGGLTQSVQA
jgi:hypothetical protein